jgi:hypothetical protein
MKWKKQLEPDNNTGRSVNRSTVILLSRTHDIDANHAKLGRVADSPLTGRRSP